MMPRESSSRTPPRSERRTRPGRIPKRQHHRASGQDVVCIHGRDHYLGPHGTRQAIARYRQLIADLLAGQPTDPRPLESIAELIAAYLRHVAAHYRKHGRPTSEISAQKTALRFLARSADLPVADFGPLRLRACRQAMIDAGLVRRSINRHIGRIRQAFRWAAENELIEPALFERLRCLRGLGRGQGGAEPGPRGPIARAHVAAALPELPAPVAAMVELQWHTGMRPGEVIQLSTGAIEIRPLGPGPAGRCWIFRPPRHKTEHHGRERIVAIGPRAQEILRPFLKADLSAPLFCPADATAAANLARRTDRPRKRPHLHRRKPGSPSLRPGAAYTVVTYRRAISRAIRRINARRQAAGESPVPHWSPNQLRHSFATRARAAIGDLDPVRAALGHSSADMTLHYARLDLEKAALVAIAIG